MSISNKLFRLPLQKQEAEQQAKIIEKIMKMQTEIKTNVNMI